MVWCLTFCSQIHNQQSCSTLDLVTTWMAGKPSRYVTNHLGQLGLLSLRSSWVPASLAGI